MSRPTFNLGLFLDKEKLKTNGSNFMSWFRNLRILLTPHKVAYVIEAALGDPPADDASDDEKKVYQTKSEDSSSSRVPCSTPWKPTCKSALRR